MTRYGVKLHDSEQRPAVVRGRCSLPRLFGWAVAPRWMAVASTVAVMLVQALPAGAQFVDCPVGQDLVKVPELVRQDDGKLRATIVLSDEQQYIAFRTPGTIPGQGTNKCAPQYVRVFRGVGAVPPAPQPAGANYPYPVPGPTLRARVGDMIELTFLNQINPGNFGDSIDRGERGLGTGCDESTGAPGYPASANDAFPDCFHGSSTGNIHFHGTHTNPNSTGDNVFVEVRPSLRENGRPIVTADSVKDSFDKFFTECESRLKNDVLLEWPKKWSDLPAAWTAEQEKLLKRYDSDPTIAEKLWPVDAAQLAEGQWPQYYIGSYPYCFRLPDWPPTPASHGPAGHGVPATAPLQMGQAPGIHWYHAHKHGSTTINVANGMTGAFIIEGKYDDELDAFYGTREVPKWTRTQPVMVINQLGVTPNLERAGPGRTDKGPDFSVNGRLSPVLTMRPGEVQLWRIVNTSSRAGLLFIGPPAGFEWKQLAQDGVQFADPNYQKSRNPQFVMMAANRVDLLVKAPTTPTGLEPYPVLVQNIVDPSDLTASTPPVKTALIQVKVLGQPVTGPQSQFIKRAPLFPSFLTDISANEVKGTKTIVFASTSPPNAQHTIDGRKFDGTVGAAVLLNTVEEWKIVNYTANPNISHPFHIHINPFQVVEVFNPNEPLVNPSTGQPIMDPQTPGTPYPKYVLDQAPQTIQGATQCRLDSGNAETWKPCETPHQAYRIWWDTFPIPSGRLTRGGSVVIPGYFKMRSRFVDYPGLYVMHCHILAHEDRGMMTVVQVTPYKPPILHR
jgi:FtsP/CotA-like multicopper oxidase with cupredoxin domain